MPIVIDIIKYALPMLLQSKGTVPVLVVAVVVLVTLPYCVIAYYDTANTNRIVAEQARTTAAIQTLTSALVTGRQNLAIYHREARP